MRKVILTALALSLAAGLVTAEDKPYGNDAREGIEWCDIWIPHANETSLPRVLLIGDSITRDYFPEVERRLAGRAYVARLSGPAFLADPVMLKQLDMVLSTGQFAVIHFNNGMHGWQHTEAEYAAAFPQYLAAIQRGAPGAKLIWASTTPLKVSPVKPKLGEASDERVAARNAIAREQVVAAGLAVDDLHAAVAGHPEYHSDNVHFNPQGIAVEGAQVAAAVEKALASQKR